LDVSVLGYFLSEFREINGFLGPKFAVVSGIRNTASAPKYWMNSGQAFAADSVFEKN